MLGDVPELVAGLRLLRGAILQMLLEELKHQLLGFRPPLQMGGRPDVQGGLPAGRLAAMPEVQQTHQMRIPPSTDQQHRPLEPALRGVMNRPLLIVAGVVVQPAPGHAFGVMALQQGWSVPQIAVVFKASADLQPGRCISASLGLEGRQLQPPSQAEVPPVGTAFTTPMASFVQAGHRRSGALRRWGRLSCGELGQALIRKPVDPQASIAFRQLPHPGMGGGGVGCFLTKPPETSLRLALSSDVLNDHQEAMGRPPTGVGVGHG